MSTGSAQSQKLTCRICGGKVRKFFDFGRQPVSNGFIRSDEIGQEFFYNLSVGLCQSCTMAQQLEEVPREKMFHQRYPFRTSLSASMSKHFEQAAATLLERELSGRNPFAVEIGSNDGVMLRVISEAGIRHLGVDPSGDAAMLAAARNIRVQVDFFDESTALRIRAAEGKADLIFSANTTSHIAYIDSVFRGVDALLAPHGVFVIEDRYLSDIVAHTIFDQIYDEHFYLFTVRSMREMAAHFGFELVDVEHQPVHGGSMRYTIARPGARPVTEMVGRMLAKEQVEGLADLDTFVGFGTRVEGLRSDLVGLLASLRAGGRTIVGYGATAKSATVTNYCGIGIDLVPYVCDSTREKHGLLIPGSHIPIRPSTDFSDPYPDYALLFAWSHAEEILAKESEFTASGGKWIFYVPDVHIV